MLGEILVVPLGQLKLKPVATERSEGGRHYIE